SELGPDIGAEEGDDPSEYPHHHYERGRRERSGDLAGRTQYAAAHGGAHHHGESEDAAEHAKQRARLGLRRIARDRFRRHGGDRVRSLRDASGFFRRTSASARVESERTAATIASPEAPAPSLTFRATHSSTVAGRGGRARDATRGGGTQWAETG